MLGYGGGPKDSSLPLAESEDRIVVASVEGHPKVFKAGPSSLPSHHSRGGGECRTDLGVTWEDVK